MMKKYGKIFTDKELAVINEFTKGGEDISKPDVMLVELTEISENILSDGKENEDAASNNK